jgi:uncharacterized protein YlxW (UPF0749 family)
VTTPGTAPATWPRSAEGLLDHITATSLDQDYAQAAARRGGAAGTPAGTPAGWARSLSVPFVVVLAVFGLLLATAAVQTARTAPTQQRSRASLVEQVQERRTELADVRTELREQRGVVASVVRARAAEGQTQTGLEQRLRRLGAATGTVPVTGPGVRITVDDRPGAHTRRQVVLDEDLQRLVNGLWVAGAEAVAINGERLTALSAVREAGEAITVNFHSLRRPYVVEAIGDPHSLPARFIESDGGTWWLNLQSVYQLRFEMTSEDSLTLPAVPTPSLRHARTAGGGAVQ